MSPKQSLLGSQAFPPPKIVQVTPSTCQNLSLFKELMKDYRSLDDAVTMRINRTNAQFRNRERSGAASGPRSQDETCAYFWKELVAGWKARTEIIQYCVNVVDKEMEEKRAVFATQDTSEDSLTRKRKQDAVLFKDEVKRKQIHNELTVEQIVRRRSLEAFQARCKYFEPPVTDMEARKWWDAALAGQ